jgi:MFS transporter, DHA2 family, multidrug resistance protein
MRKKVTRMTMKMTTRGSRKWWALGALTLAVLAVGLDGTVLSVAIPTLAGALNAGEADLQWFSSGYLLVLAAAMLPMGLFGDRFGRKKVLLLALFLFGVGSAACAYAPTAGAFIAARFVLGLAGAGIIVMALSGLTVLFTPEERPRAVGIWAAANFIAFPIGPILGGYLLTHYWWGWVFLMNVPVALIGLVAVLLLVPESRAPERPGLDILGIVLSVAGLAGLTYGFIRAGQDGWTEAGALVAIVGGVLVLVGFFLWEYWLGRRPGGEPLVDLRLLRSGSFTWGILLLTVLVLGMTGVLFTLPQFYQGVLGTDAMGSGVRLLPLVGGLIVGAVPADRLARLVGAKITVALGFVLFAIGMFIGSTTSASSSDGFIAAWVALIGLGLGITFATAASAALVEIPSSRSGVASAMMQALQKAGGPLGAAIMGSVLSSVYLSKLQLTGLPPAVATVVRQSLFGGLAVADKLHSPALLRMVQGAFVNGMDVSLVVAGGMALVGLVLTLLFLPSKTTPKGEQAAAAVTSASSANQTGPHLVGATSEGEVNR